MEHYDGSLETFELLKCVCQWRCGVPLQGGHHVGFLNAKVETPLFFICMPEYKRYWCFTALHVNRNTENFQGNDGLNIWLHKSKSAFCLHVFSVLNK